MPRGWLVAVLALLVIGLVPQVAAQVQDQPEASVEIGSFPGPLPPTKTTEIPVNATVSCEGWGEAGQRTLALFSLQDPPSPYEVSFGPAELEVPAGAGDCQPGETLDVSTTLQIRPTRKADAGNHFSRPVVLVLEERANGETVNRYGPYSEQISFHTGFVPDVEVELVDREVELAWRESVQTQLQIHNHANGPARVDIQVRQAPEQIRVEVEPDELDVPQGEQAEVTVQVTDRSSNPSGAQEGTIRLDTRAFDPQMGPEATDAFSIQASTTGPSESAPLKQLLALGLGLLLAGVVGYHHTAGRLVPVEFEAEPRQASDLETAVASWLVALGIPATVWGTAGSILLLVCGLLALAAGLWLVRGASLPERVHRLFAEREVDRVGTSLLGLGGVILFGLGVASPSGTVAEVLVVVALVSLFAGAWALARRIPSRWPGRAVLAGLVVFGFVPMLVESKSLVVGAFGSSLFAIPVGLVANFVAVLGRGLPLLAAFTVLSVRTRRWGRASAWMGAGLVLAMGLAPRSVLDPLAILAGPGAGDQLLVVAVSVCVLAGVAWLAIGKPWAKPERSDA